VTAGDTLEHTSTTRRWSMLAVALTATLSANVFINGVAFLIPALLADRTSLAKAALLASMPSVGMMLTLIPWGYLLDRVGEKITLALGLGLTAVAGFAAASVHSMVAVATFLTLGGMAAASTISASGRLVTGWFADHQRATVMGIRQTAQPLGIAVAALVIPELSRRSLSLALLFPAVLCAASAVASVVGVRDPHRPPRRHADEAQLASPYRGPLLWRIHVASALLMVPQPLVLTFMLVWYTTEHHLSVVLAGVLVGASQLVGAVGRVAAGRWADRVGSRMRPVRTLAVATAVIMILLALGDHFKWGVAIALMVVAAAIAGDNGLPFTTIAEVAGPYWSGWALGKQNTFERLVVAAAPPAFALVITAAGYPLAFALSALFPLASVPLVPVRDNIRAR
jgi:sugar phosphate permease